MTKSPSSPANPSPAIWLPKRASALQALQDFLPRSGHDYAITRNEDRGPDDRTNVSGLSPWIRLRMLTEPEIVSAVLAHHTYPAAEKFIQEICWRTYWKGWLEARPGVWQTYLNGLQRAQQELEQSTHYRTAIEGKTGIDCFDAFARELVETGYLHNHARMWFASIWIFTLKLPWVLGADFFFRHLLDGDPASNTLSWRWVAGLQTQGKHYVATAGNIRRYTAGRFQVNAPLAENPAPLQEASWLPNPLPFSVRQQQILQEPIGILVAEDDLSAPAWLNGQHPVASTAFVMPESAYQAANIEPHVLQFRREAMANTAAELRSQQGSEVTVLEGADDVATIVSWAQENHLRTVLMAEPPVGLWDQLKSRLEVGLREAGVTLVFRRHAWDEAFYPHATKGFFHLKKIIPSVIAKGIGP